MLTQDPETCAQAQFAGIERRYTISYEGHARDT
jgi:hypothetical protein